MSCQRSIFHALTPEAFISDVILMLASTIFQMVIAREDTLFSCVTHQTDVVLLHGVLQSYRELLDQPWFSLVDNSETAIYLSKLTGPVSMVATIPFKHVV